MRDSGLHSAPSAPLGLLMAILVPYVGHLMNKVTTMVVGLGEAKTRLTQKGTCPVGRRALVAKKDGPLKITQT